MQFTFVIELMEKYNLISLAQEAAEKEKRHAERRKAEVRRLGQKVQYEDKAAKMISVVRDKKTGQVFIEKSGKPLAKNIHPEIGKRMPKSSRTPWDIRNCAEIKACNAALYARSDTKMEDLEIATVKVRNGDPKQRCDNCKSSTAGATVFTD